MCTKLPQVSGRLRRHSGTGDAIAVMRETATTFAGPFDREELAAQLGGDEELVREVIDLFLQDCPNQVSAIKAAVDSGDDRQLYVVAHTLKGAASTLTAHGVAEVARVLEMLGREGRAVAGTGPCQELEIEASRLLEVLRASA